MGGCVGASIEEGQKLVKQMWLIVLFTEFVWKVESLHDISKFLSFLLPFDLLDPFLNQLFTQDFEDCESFIDISVFLSQTEIKEFKSQNKRNRTEPLISQIGIKIIDKLADRNIPDFMVASFGPKETFKHDVWKDIAEHFQNVGVEDFWGWLIFLLFFHPIQSFINDPWDLGNVFYDEGIVKYATHNSSFFLPLFAFWKWNSFPNKSHEVIPDECIFLVVEGFFGGKKLLNESWVQQSYQDAIEHIVNLHIVLITVYFEPIVSISMLFFIHGCPLSNTWSQKMKGVNLDLISFVLKSLLVLLDRFFRLVAENVIEVSPYEDDNRKNVLPHFYLKYYH